MPPKHQSRIQGATARVQLPQPSSTRALLVRALAGAALWAGATTSQAAMVYDAGELGFSTTGQSMWGTGAATQFADSVFVGTQWTNRTTSLGGFTGSLSQVTVNTNPAWWVWQACSATGAPSWVCGSEPSRGTVRTVVDTRTGAQMDLTSSGKFGLEFGYAIDSGSVGASADFSALAVLPTDALLSGQFFNLQPTATLNYGSITSQSPKAEAYINAIAELSGSVSASACLITLGCTPRATASLPTLDAHRPILSIDPGSLKVLPDLLPAPDPADPRLPLAEVALLNQELTLEGALSATGVPGFKLSTSQFTIASTVPPVPAINVDLASIQFNLPDIATSGGLQGDAIRSSGRDDFIQARVDIDGVAAMTGFPPTGLGIDLVDAGGFKIGMQFDALDIDAGPDIGITQDFELRPTLMTRLDFSTPILIQGFTGPQAFWQGRWDQFPDIALLDTTTVSPTFWIDAMLTNSLGIDLGLTGTMDILKLTFNASAGGVDIIGTSPISLNSLLGLGNELFSTDKLRFPVYSTPFLLEGFDPIHAAAFTLEVASRVPSPGTLALMASALIAVGAFRCRRTPFRP